VAILDARPAGARLPAAIELTPEQARIPTSRYTSPEFAAAERERMWARTWQMACRVEDLAEPGAWVRYDVADQSYVVVRGDDGAIRAFANVCRHRGNQIKAGACGVHPELRCPYHFWSWSLDGSLRTVPDRELFCDLVDDDYALPQIACDTWAGFVFVNPGPDPEPLDTFLGEELRAQLAPYHLDRMRRVVDIVTPVSANWKVVVEAFLEVYHVQGIHPQLLAMLDDTTTTFECFDTHSMMIVPFGVPSMRVEDVTPAAMVAAYERSSGFGGGEPLTSATVDATDLAGAREQLIERAASRLAATGTDCSGLSRDQLIDDWHYHVFPNLVFNAHAGSFLFFRIRPDWASPDRCFFDLQVFAAVPEEQRASYRYAAPAEIAERSVSLGEVMDQDLENLPRVQRGLHADTLELVTLSRQEIRIVKLHEVLDRYLAAPQR
jgi:phenylpropionate dioxygenase-like ring-hydroxylating dioxygenase large terminal subunit